MFTVAKGFEGMETVWWVSDGNMSFKTSDEGWDVWLKNKLNEEKRYD